MWYSRDWFISADLGPDVYKLNAMQINKAVVHSTTKGSMY